MTRMTGPGPDCAVIMCNLINTYIHTTLCAYTAYYKGDKLTDYNNKVLYNNTIEEESREGNARR